MSTNTPTAPSAAPLVSVVMAVHNGAEFLAEAIESILAQTYSKLELLVIDDGSTDSSLGILRGYAVKDHRVKVIVNEVNLGLASSLNRGFDLATGKYVARMDCDDISLPRRLEKQVKFMEDRTDISVCGTMARFFGYQTALKKYPTHHEVIRATLLFYTPIFHPSVMFRKSDIAQLDYLYEADRKRVEDLELWARLTTRFKVANLPDCLLKYRVYNPLSVEKRKAVVAHGNIIRQALLKALAGDLTEAQFRLHMKIARCERNDSMDFMSQAADWLENLLDANQRNASFEPGALSEVVSERWWRLCKSSTELGPGTYRIYQSRPQLSRYNPGALMNLAWFWKRHLFFRNASDSIHDENLDWVSHLPKNPT